MLPITTNAAARAGYGSKKSGGKNTRYRCAGRVSSGPVKSRFSRDPWQFLPDPARESGIAVGGASAVVDVAQALEFDSNKRWKAYRGFDVGIHCALDAK